MDAMQKEAQARFGNILADRSLTHNEIVEAIKEMEEAGVKLYLKEFQGWCFDTPGHNEDTLFKVLGVGKDLGMSTEDVEKFVTEYLNRGLLFRERPYFEDGWLVEHDPEAASSEE